MKRTLLLLLCSSPLLNAMTEVKVKQDNVEALAAKLRSDLFGKAVENNWIDIAKELLAKRINPNNICNGYNRSPLMCALKFYKSDYPDMVKLLIAHGAEFAEGEKFNMDKLSDKKKLALLHAIEAGKKERQALLEAEKNLTVAKLPTEAEEKKEIL